MRESQSYTRQEREGKQEHWLKTLLNNKLEGIFKLDPRTMTEGDIKKIEGICNSILDNGEIDIAFFHNKNPIKGIQVNRIRIQYVLDDEGFVIPSSCKWLIN